MEFQYQLQTGRLIRRYKRFLADVALPSGQVLTVHCPNSGSMRGCMTPGSAVMISRAENPRRKYPYTLEMIHTDGTWVGINTSRTNLLVREALLAGLIEEIGPVENIEAEVRVSARSRLDFLLSQGEHRTYVEVKNCTLVEDRWAMFPDAVTSRGTKHLQELLALREAGHRAAVLFCVQRTDAEAFRPAAHIDPLYAATLQQVNNRGVLVLAYQAEVTPKRIGIVKSLPVRLHSDSTDERPAAEAGR